MLSDPLLVKRVTRFILNSGLLNQFSGPNIMTVIPKHDNGEDAEYTGTPSRVHNEECDREVVDPQAA